MAREVAEGVSEAEATEVEAEAPAEAGAEAGAPEAEGREESEVVAERALSAETAVWVASADEAEVHQALAGRAAAGKHLGLNILQQK